LFSAISRSWRARPLTSHEVVIETIRATTTTTGLTVNAELDLGTYEKGIKISDQQIRDLETSQLHRHEFHPDWNYTMHPATADTRDTPEHTHLNQT
jgi:Rhodopirellula transposase DDE domain